MKNAAIYADEPSLSPGLGFHLQPDGNWKAEPIPPKVVKEAQYSGHLTIFGYDSVVFEMPNKDMWAQKTTESAEETEEGEVEAGKLASLHRIAAKIVERLA